MGCGDCVRWRPVLRGTFGFCRWPGLKPEPYWRAAHPNGDLMTHQSHGENCAALRARRT